MYKCKNAVAMIMFNRPQKAEKVFEKVRMVEPAKLYLIVDGPRNDTDSVQVHKSQRFQELVDWKCEVVCIFSDKNLGCKKRIITGLTKVFEKEERAIVLEDDCVPTIEFFEFQDWALEYYKDHERIAVVSGSNLLDYETSQEYKNGFSMYINCWGWGTWKRVWEKYNGFLSIEELNKTYKSISRKVELSYCQKKYWLNIFRHSIYTRAIWDFYLQYFFFKYSWRSVYPTCNLIQNIGFGEDSTYMKKQPAYIECSIPQQEKIKGLFQKPLLEYTENNIDRMRDKKVLKTVYGYSFFSCFKLSIANILRYLGLLR